MQNYKLKSSFGLSGVKDVGEAEAGEGAQVGAEAEEAGLSRDLALFLKAKPGMISHQTRRRM